MINDALKMVRVYHTLKQKELAKALELSPSYLNELERGKKQVTLEVLEKYSNYFKIPTSSLLYFAEHKDQHGEEKAVNPIAAKAIKMLDWVATITSDDENDETVSP